MRKVSLIRLVILSFLCLWTGTPAAQPLPYDPLLDPACKEIPGRETETWTHTYMWYPGQLASHMQKQLKQISEDRCVNVGYPGKFNKDTEVTYFRKRAKVKSPVLLRWNAPSRVVCSVNGKKLDETAREQTLEKGEHDLCFEVRSSGRLPALIVQGEGIEELPGWEVSLDGFAWNKPETSTRYNRPAKFPDESYETTVRIQPYEWLPVRNSEKEGSTLIVGKNGYALIDFRHLEVGVVELEVKGKGTLSFRVGESPEEALNTNERLFEQYAIPPFGLDGSVQTVRLPERALRYLALESSEFCEVRSAYFDAAIWPVTYQMKFESSDKELNKLWSAAGATLHTSMHNFYLDGVKRDYLPWSMDAIVSAFAGDYLFADPQVSHNGLSVALMPPDPEASDLGIIDYPLHALVGFKHDYLRYGDLNTSLLYKDRIIRMLAFYETIQDERGFISSVHSTAGFVPGWATKDGPSGRGAPAYGQMMLYLNYLTGSYFADLWKEKKLAGHYRKKAEALKKSILDHFWDADRRAFINGYGLDGKADTRISHHAQYWGILTDLFPEEDYGHLFDEVLPCIPHYKKDISYEKGYEFLANDLCA